MIILERLEAAFLKEVDIILQDPAACESVRVIARGLVAMLFEEEEAFLKLYGEDYDEEYVIKKTFGDRVESLSPKLLKQNLRAIAVSD